MDGRKLEIYPSMYVPDIRLLKREDFEWIMQGRQMNRRRPPQNPARDVRATRSTQYNTSNINSNSQPETSATSTAIVPVPPRSVSFSGSIMGGRNEQAENRHNGGSR